LGQDRRAAGVEMLERHTPRPRMSAMESARDIAKRQGSAAAELAEARSVVILQVGELEMVA
jgi:hypothetical protein